MSEGASQPLTVVVNDDPTQLEILCGLALKAGLRPLPFTRAEEALRAINSSPPDLIVTDVYMPDLDGWRFCRLLRSPEYKFCNEIPILIVSATFAGDHPERIAADIGADAFLPSPVNGEDFVAQTRALLQGKNVLRQPRALIVDDGKALAGALKSTFSAHGYQADTAFSVYEAKEAFARTTYDVVVLDYHLPDGTGDGLLDNFRAVRPDCACLMITTDPTPELALDWMKRGASAYLRKPFEPKFLIELCVRARRELALLRTEDLLESRTRELRESDKRYRTLFERTASPIMIVDTKGSYVDANDAALRFLECSREELLKKNVVDFITPGRNNVQEEHLHAWQACGVLETQYFIKGMVKTLILNITPGMWNGQPVVFGNGTDITARKAAEEKLLKSERLLANALTMARLGHWEMDVSSGTFVFSDNFYEIFRTTADEMGGYRMSLDEYANRFLPAEDRHYVAEEARKALETDDPNYSRYIEHRMLYADGSLGHIAVKFFIEKDEQEKTIRSFGVSQDISERKRAEHALLAARDMAEAANRAKSEFLANMSHEIRTPLNGILGMLQLLETTTLDEEQLQYCSLAVQSTKRLTTLLSDILDLARVEARKLLIRAERFNVPDTITQVIDLFEPVGVQTSVALNRHIDPDLPHWAVGDSIRLQQVLSNLIGNAFKFTKNGTVHVEAFPLPSHVPDTVRLFFAIADTGAGIADDELKNLFQPFTQVSQGFTRNHQGAGLGLTISKQLVTLMGGTMAVESEVGGGTTFYFCINVGKVAQRHRVEASEGNNISSAESYRILLAEDDETTIFGVSRLLEKSGHRVIVAKNGQEAFDLHVSHDFDLILMDVQMPVLDGIESTRRIREDGPEEKRSIPIIALTAYSMNGDREKFLAAGMNGYIAKPIEFDTLLQTVGEIKRPKKSISANHL